jgi:hypothetical protein
VITCRAEFRQTWWKSGTWLWQQIFHLECDVRGGREPTIVVTVMGDERQSI